MVLVYCFLLVAARIAALVLAAPILGSRCLPFTARLTVVLTAALAVLPVVAGQSSSAERLAEARSTDLIPMLFSEALIGSLLGLCVLITCFAAQMVGDALGHLAGIQTDLQSDEGIMLGSSPTSRLLALVSLAVFVLIGGPELALGGIFDSFSNLPVGTAFSQRSAFELLVSILRQSFLLTLKAICPAIAATWICMFAISMISRSLPHLNLPQIGLAANMSVLLLAVFLTLGGCVWLFVIDVESTIQSFQYGLVPVGAKN
jgi:flagellar biosynthetic protein FliR